MPTYEYECFACKEKFSVIQKMSDPHLRACVKCNEEPVKRLISRGVGVVFKGSGWTPKYGK